jgi:hypothetical protein
MPRMRWLALLLVPQPPLSFAYLMAVRARQIEPSFLPPMLLAAFPLAAAGLSAYRLFRDRARARFSWLALGVSVIELLWAMLTLSIVGFAIAWRSG